MFITIKLGKIAILTTCLLILTDILIYPQQIINPGIPFIRNYSPEVYKASEQNWSIYQDKKGVFYFGNTLGLLEFDGITWQLIELPGKSAVRSVCPEETGKIFIGGINEIGYLVTDETGKTNYCSLIQLIPKEYRQFNDVWEIFSLNKEIIFRTYSYIFIFKNEKISVIKATNDFRSASKVYNKIFITDSNLNIYNLENNKLNLIPSNKLLFDRHPLFLPFTKKKTLIATRKNGLFIYDDNKLIRWNTPINEFLIKNLLYCALQIDSNYYAFGTWLNGLIIIDKTGKPIQYINKEFGLISNSIYYLYTDKEKNLWCAMDGGIAQIEINSPFTFFNSNLGFETPCYTSLLYKNNFYIGGVPYIYYKHWQNYEDPLNRKPFVKIPGTAPELWQLNEINGELYGAHSFDLIKIKTKNTEATAVNNKIVWNLKKINVNSRLLLAGENDGIYVLKNVNNKWKLRNKISGYSELGRWIEIDVKNYCWCSTYGDRIFRLKFNDNFDSVTYLKYYDIKPNYPLSVGNRLTIVNDKIIVSGEDGFYIYNEINNRFEPYAVLNNLIVKGKPVNITGYDKNGNIWFTDCESTGEFIKQSNGSYKIIRNQFYKLDIPSESYPVFPINDSIVIIGKSNGFVYYDPEYKKDYTAPFNTLIRKIELLNSDSEYFESEISQVKNSELKIKCRNNSIRFKYVATYYENVEKNQFQYRLSGYEKYWSKWTSETKKDYTNLPAGHYTFYVRSRNVFRISGTTAKMDFYIQPPWYLSLWAYLSFIIIIIGVVYLIVHLNSRRLKVANVKLEEIIDDRTTEIKNQKEIIQSQLEQLKDSQGLKDKFYSIISHDLINAIGNLKSFSELLKRYTSTLNDSKLDKYSSGLYNSSSIAFELLTNLLNWTRIQTKRMKLNLEKFNLIELINDTLKLYIIFIEKKKLNITTNYPEYLLIDADKNMISTILRNLLSNAVKFTPENGKISITVCIKNEEYKFEIADTGIGMSDEELEKLFRKDIFFQRQGTNFESGTGFGLLLIKEFIELHNGNITVESEPDQGSKFSFTAPLNLSASLNQEPGTKNHEQG